MPSVLSYTMIETIRYLWQDARRSMAERKTARTLDREIHRLQRLENTPYGATRSL
jgi:hypothetical protein